MAPRMDSGACLECALRATDFFRGIRHAARKEFERLRVPGTYRRGDIVFRDGDQPSGMYFLCEGKVKIVKSSFGSKSHITRVVKAPDLLGDRAFIAGNLYSGTGVAMGDCRICHLGAANFSSLFSRDHGFWKLLARRFAGELGRAEVRMADLALKTVRERLAKCILDAMTPEPGGTGGTSALGASRQETAEIVGTTPEAVCRTLAEFRGRGWISVEGTVIRVRDASRLRSLAKLGLP